MEVKKIHILDYKPCLTGRSINKIVDEIISSIDVYNEMNKFEEVYCDNGFMIEVHVGYVGINYRIIKISYLEVHLYNAEIEGYEITDDCEVYTEKINSLLSEKIYELNGIAEEEFETQHTYL